MQIRIGLITYTVVALPELASAAGELHGDINFAKCRIRLDADDNPQRQLQTLWHEIIHGILHGAGIRDNHDEQQIEVISHGILQVLRDNPHLTPAGPAVTKE